MRGLTMSVLRNARYDATNGGISSTAQAFTLVGVMTDTHLMAGETRIEPVPENMQVFEAYGDQPAVVVRVRTIGRENILSIEPYLATDTSDRPWFMFGGNFAHTSDSRAADLFATLLGHRFYGALAIHDRIEA